MVENLVIAPQSSSQAPTKKDASLLGRPSLNSSERPSQAAHWSVWMLPPARACGTNASWPDVWVFAYFLAFALRRSALVCIHSRYHTEAAYKVDREGSQGIIGGCLDSRQEHYVCDWAGNV